MDYFLDNKFPVCYLDEKWFCTVLCQRKIKVLPLGDSEENDADKIVKPKCRSQRFPIKVMYLGDVARPNELFKFNGRICLERVSRTKTVDTRFSNDGLVNDEIKWGVDSVSHRQHDGGGYVGNNCGDV